MQENIIKINKILIHQAQMLGENDGDYESALYKINEAINNLVHFSNTDEAEEKRDLLYQCYFISGRYQFEVKKFSVAIENFITAKLFCKSKQDLEKISGWAHGTLDEYEFLLKEKETKDTSILELKELDEKLNKNEIQIPRIKELIKQYG